MAKKKSWKAKKGAVSKESPVEIFIDSLRESDVDPIIKRQRRDFKPNMSDTDEHLREEITQYSPGDPDYSLVSSVSKAKADGIEDVIGYTYGDVMKIGDDFFSAIAYHSSDKKSYGKETHEQRIDDFEKKANKKAGKKGVKMFIIEATNAERKKLEEKGYKRITRYSQPTIRREEDGSTKHKPVENLHLMIKYNGKHPTKEQISSAIGKIWEHWYRRGEEGKAQYDRAMEEHKEMMKGMDKRLTNYFKQK